ncbi:hypothetical protein MIH18_20890 [Marinobacter sp. M3C]|jgi:hypothetical protein|uniref:hypothetical protein n=1 Tax=unclassified Marinobacter TaxID=83889 RepID=UPI00200E7FA6|nr:MULTISPECIES: hypothetical protein [unclassified Marinobacter]MCL1479738.1 hypothetical protein [Marinobacter sp.]MCL1481478.1 hypothetical protein [Marinobacter sp.]UQG54468.1 hypothetical protein MIH16_13555 [Marinobacter sp. M4C]UQG60129.1 hypothetical protein MIH18_20890 [Marinobacter sp. M3C]UQG63273.1 hypothetical protein MIH17_13550 [Marinobacter sp. M2C]
MSTLETTLAKLRNKEAVIGIAGLRGKTLVLLSFRSKKSSSLVIAESAERAPESMVNQAKKAYA